MSCHASEGVGLNFRKCPSPNHINWNPLPSHSVCPVVVNRQYRFLHWFLRYFSSFRTTNRKVVEASQYQSGIIHSSYLYTNVSRSTDRAIQNLNLAQLDLIVSTSYHSAALLISATCLKAPPPPQIKHLQVHLHYSDQLLLWVAPGYPCVFNRQRLSITGKVNARNATYNY